VGGCQDRHDGQKKTKEKMGSSSREAKETGQEGTEANQGGASRYGVARLGILKRSRILDTTPGTTVRSGCIGEGALGGGQKISGRAHRHKAA